MKNKKCFKTCLFLFGLELLPLLSLNAFAICSSTQTGASILGASASGIAISEGVLENVSTNSNTTNNLGSFTLTFSSLRIGNTAYSCVKIETVRLDMSSNLFPMIQKNLLTAMTLGYKISGTADYYSGPNFNDWMIRNDTFGVSKP